MRIEELVCNAVVLLSLFQLSSSVDNINNLLPPSDASALLSFKSKADLGNKLPFSNKTSFSYCEWPGVQCLQRKVSRLVLESLNLGGIFAPNTLTRLHQLRVLSLQNNSLVGPLPDLSALLNLKTLFLDHNFFTGLLPPSISSLHRLRTLDLSFNNLTGPLPFSFTNLDRLYYLRLDSNRLNASIPPLNQSTLLIFNISANNLTGAVPVTPALLRFGKSSFAGNAGLCGEVVHKECRPMLPFFGSSTPEAPPPPVVLGQNEQIQEAELNRPSRSRQKRTGVIVGFSAGVVVLICSALCFVMAVKKQKNQKVSTTMASDYAATADAEAVMRIEEENELEEKVKKVQSIKSGSLVFCAGESRLYALDQLMRASAELLGKGSIGTTYKAVLDNRLIVCVKRLDAGKLAGTSHEEFERHMESVGGLRHPNLVPLRAYYQAKDERLLVYDYQPNGSLFSLIHGSKSAKAKPLHWTSCLKIAEDVAQGLSYIHQAWRLVHGNLKSSNVLLGSDFEACLTDYCLSILTDPPSSDEDSDSAAYKAPETLKLNSQATTKSDVYTFGILLLVLVTGKPPSQHPYLMPDDMVKWVRSARGDEGVGEDNRLIMLVEVAMACSGKSPEQRPTMWQVLKMIQEIKETVIMDDCELDPTSGIS
ncbi:hypothetical protein LguiA_006625 [Lonicera macranthoides]